jgi:hypothetical protein
MRTSDLIFAATLQLKSALDPVVPILEQIAKTDPNYVEIAQCYKVIRSELEKVATLLKEMPA